MTDKVRDFHWHKPDRIKQPDEGSVEITRAVRDMSIRLFAMTGAHCETLRLILRTKPVPPDLQVVCDRERALFVADSDAWWLRHHGGEP